MQISSYKELIVWQKSILLVKEIYSITKLFPKFETYVLTSQILRSAISIPSNIAEGYARGHRPEFIQFLSVAFGSAVELETQLIIAKNEYVDIDFQKSELLIVEIQKMLQSMIKKLKSK